MKSFSASPFTDQRDLYGHEPTTAHGPDDRPYPPYFPSPGHYSTELGYSERASAVSTTSADSDGEWNRVKTRRTANRKRILE